MLIPGSACGLDHVVLQLKWKHQFQFAGYYAALEKGYYREAGLDVELREAAPGGDPLHEVIDGRAQYGVGTSNVMLARAGGPRMVVLAVIYQHSPFVLLTKDTEEVRDIHDLADKPIMMEPDAAELLAYFQREGVDISRLKMVHHTFAVQDLVDGKVAAMSAYSTDEPFYMRKMGLDYQVFSPRAGGIDFYGDNLFTTEGQIQKHPEQVKAFVEASIRGWEYAMKNPGEMIDLILAKYSRGKSREQLMFEAEETARLVHPELIEMGYINPGRWKAIADTYKSLGMLPADFSLKGFLYQRTPVIDLRWLYWVGGVVLVVALGSAAWALLISRLNRKLYREIAARERAEALARAESAEKTHFYAVLAHEVRTPLAGIIAALWLGREKQSDAERAELVEIAEGSAKNLLCLVDHILDHSQIASGQVEIERVSIEVRQFLEEIISLFMATARTKGLSMSQDIAANVPRIVETDPLRLRQVLSNVIANAIKFTTNGGVSIRVTSEKAGEEEVRLIFQISDTGAGIARERLEDVFMPFSQEKISIARQYGGTGLGLSISLGLAKVMGGDIAVASEPGKGSVFTISVLAGGISDAGN